MKIKKMDIIVIIILFIASLGLVFFTKNMTKKEAGDLLIIEVDGEEYGRYDLGKNQTIEIKSKDDGVNKIEIKDNKAKMIYANCPDLVCTNMPAIKNDGETIVCLPHKLLIEVKSDRENKIDQVVQ